MISDSLVVLFMGVNPYCQGPSIVDSLSLSGHVSIEVRNISSIEIPIWSHYYSSGCASFIDKICNKPSDGMLFNLFDESNRIMRDKRGAWLSFDLPKPKMLGPKDTLKLDHYFHIHGPEGNYRLIGSVSFPDGKFSVIDTVLQLRHCDSK